MSQLWEVHNSCGEAKTLRETAAFQGGDRDKVPLEDGNSQRRELKEKLSIRVSLCEPTQVLGSPMRCACATETENSLVKALQPNRSIQPQRGPTPAQWDTRGMGSK